MQGKKFIRYGAAAVLGGTMLISTVFSSTVLAEETFWDEQTEELEALNDYENLWLTVGSAGDQVSYVQQLLNNAGYATVVDGDYGVYTSLTVMAFQGDHGLYQDGIVGPGTMAVLVSAAGGAAAPAPAPEPEPAPEPAAQEAPASPADTQSLSVGSSGESVRKLQQKLSELGYYYGIVDGDYGQHTASAVSAFQGAHGLYVDGYAGPLTLAALYGTASPAPRQTSSSSSSSSNTELNPNGYLSVGSQGEQVKLLQQKLSALGYWLEPDGDYGQVTAEAVKKFQSMNHLYVDGEAGPLTLKALLGNPVAYDPNEEQSELQRLTRQKLDQVGWDLYRAYKWAVDIPYVKWAVGSNVEEGALYAFRNGQGDCIGKAAAFCAMARELGYECHVIWGKVPYRAGGYGDHAWVEIVNNGATYVCDPQFEWNDGRNGYMINYGQSGTWMYQRDGYFPG